ncbi:hypothetical protein JW756_04660 [Candidatus Woesearchaeota archaeon]|nr:hypothetical protein [Candidatus Woesearchaeota archaeon]
MATPTSEWETIKRPGWFGEGRDNILSGYDRQYGPSNWRIRHILGPRILDFNESVQLYELSYELDFNHPDRRYIWNNLITRAKDVWTEQLTDINSGMDYSIQKAPAAHYEDIAIRRIMDKYGKKFKGEELIRVRADSEDLVGKVLSSIHIPFIYPDYIESPPDDKIYWWNRHKGSLECFWHFNKVLQVKKE